MRQLKILVKVMMNRHQKLLLNFQKEQVLETESTHSDDCYHIINDELIIDDIQKKNSKGCQIIAQSVTQLHSKVKLADLDKKVLGGLFDKHINTTDSESDNLELEIILDKH